MFFNIELKVDRKKKIFFVETLTVYKNFPHIIVLSYKQCARRFCGHQNPTKGHVAFSGFSAVFPPPSLPDCLQNAITFFLFGLCWVWKSMLDKSIHFVCFPKKNLSLSVSHHFYSSFFKKLSPFCQKLRILAGNRQTTKKNFKWKVWMF